MVINLSEPTKDSCSFTADIESICIPSLGHCEEDDDFDAEADSLEVVNLLGR